LTEERPLKKGRFLTALALCILALMLMPTVLLYPDSGFFYGPVVIPFITGVFLRSMMVGLFFLAAWIYRYGFVWTLVLGFAYWGFAGMVFDLTSATTWGGNVLSNFWLLLSYGQSLPDLLMRIVILPTATLTTFIFKLYRVSPASLSMLVVWLSFLVGGAALLPHSYLLGESKIPETLLPQLYEFAALVVSFVFALSFFRPYKGSAKL
jgi:hypothetical protein